MDEQPIYPANQIPDQSELQRPSNASPGCWTSGWLILMTVWIFLLTIISQVLTWAVEQQIFEGAYRVPDVRWVITLVYGLLIIFPALALWWINKNYSNRGNYLAFALAGGFTLLLAPARLPRMTASLETDFLLIVGMGLGYALLHLAWRRRLAIKGGWQGAGVAMIVAGLSGFPWVLWGAFGSVWDTALNLVAALMFGLLASQIARLIFYHEPGRQARGRDVLFGGFIFAEVLGIMTTGLGVNGNQGLLTAAAPVLGWAAAILYHAPNDGGRDNAPALALMLGLVAFWPMAFIDPDELATVISLGPGELIQWANQAAFTTLGIGLLAGVLLFRLRFSLTAARRNVIRIAAGLVWAIALGLYLGPGQPGFFGERLFVILKEQADVSPAANISNYNRRRTVVYQSLVITADSSQAGLRQVFDRFQIPYQAYYLENAIEVQGGPLLRLWLENRPEVDRVLDSPMLRPLPEPPPESHGTDDAPSGTPWNLQMIGADRVWNELKVTGKGIVVGQSDSGVDGMHPELAGSYRGTRGNNTYNWYDPWYHSASPTDIGGHGTHTLATAVGRSVGVAPGAEWIGCVNLARNLGNPALYLDCMQFMLAPFPQNGDPLRDGQPELGAQVLNDSWGCPWVEGCDPEALLPAVKALRAAGIFVVASAGNGGQGGCGSITDPLALYGQVYSVGAVDSSGALTDFSSTGPVEVDGSQRVKPDITAPGARVISAFPGNTYSSLSGTSMAGPHVVGVVALMWSANPALVGNIDLTQQILDETATPYTGPLPQCVAPGRPNDGVGYGIVNAYAAVKKAMGQ